MIEETQLTVYERTQWRKIQEWEAAAPGIVGRAAAFLAKPVGNAVQMIPAGAVEAALKSANFVGKNLADVQDILRDGEVERIELLRGRELRLCDSLADGVHNRAIGLAAAEGGATGVAGLPGLVADVPALMVLVLRTIHKIGYCYGYAAKTPEEDAFALQILAAASANSLQEKAGALMAMAELEQRLQAVAVSGVGTGYQESLGKETVLLLIQRLARQVGINLTKRKVLEMVPGLGALVGAAMNGNYLQDVSWTARRKFQSRWLREKYPKLQEFEKP